MYRHRNYILTTLALFLLLCPATDIFASNLFHRTETAVSHKRNESFTAPKQQFHRSETAMLVTEQNFLSETMTGSLLDSVETFDHYDSLFLDKDKRQIGSNVATNDSVDITKYMMENRHRFQGESFSKDFKDHLYLFGGLGIKGISVPTGGIKFNPLTVVTFGIGKQIDKYHGLRFGVRYAQGYQQVYGNPLMQVGAQLDYLFDWSAYTRGYMPERKVSVSSILGLTTDFNNMKSQGHAMNYGGRMGLQVRFFTGPQGYVDVEPYVGMEKDNLGINKGAAAWRPYEITYGANVNFTYFLRNNLSSEAQAKYLAEDSRNRDYWRTPFFVEYGAGALFNFGDSRLSWSNSIGHMSQISVGKWISSAFGVKLSYAFSQTNWDEVFVKGDLMERIHDNTTRYHVTYGGVFGEAMINPLGFTRKYDYERSWGLYAMFGMGGVGRLNKYAEDNYHVRSTSYTAGVHIWKSLTRDLQVFVEPRYIHHVYHKKGANVFTGKIFSDDNINVSAGLTVNFRPQRLRYIQPEDSTYFPTKRSHWRIGGGAGMTLTLDRYTYDEGFQKFNWGATVFCNYDITPLHGVRLSVDFASRNNYTVERYKDIFEQSANSTAGSVYRFNKRNLMGGYLGFGYDLNLLEAFSGYNPDRRWHLHFYVGPALAGMYTYTTDVVYHRTPDHLSSAENPDYTLEHEKKIKMRLGGHAGLQLTYDFTQHLGIFLSPTFYAFKNMDLPFTVSLNQIHVLQNINLGLQYRF